MTDDELLERIYYKDKNFDGANELYRKARMTNKNIKKHFILEWLRKQEPAQRTAKRIISKKDFLPIYNEAPNAYQIDLTFFDRYTKQNKGYNTLFTAINTNTRFVYAYPSKNKSMDEIIKIIRDMIKKTEIDSITCDKGLEFNNINFRNFCENEEIELYLVKGDSHKLGIINRFHRTLKEKLTKNFIATDSVNWIDVIDEIIKNYNNSYNRGIETTPNNINGFKEIENIEKFKNKTDELKSRDNYNVGDSIRLLEDKKLFQDKMIPKYSKEVYKILKVNKNNIKIMKDDEEVIIKKSEAKKIPEGIYNTKKSNQEEVNKEHKIMKRNQREGIDIKNII